MHGSRMRPWWIVAFVIAGLAVRGTTAHADCVHVTAADAVAAAELERVVATELAAAPGACLDVALVGLDVVEDGGQVTMTARVSVVVSAADRISSIVSGRATLRADRREVRRRRVTLQHDVLDEAIAHVAPALRAHRRD
jgi:hypothetical protein